MNTEPIPIYPISLSQYARLVQGLDESVQAIGYGANDTYFLARFGEKTTFRSANAKLEVPAQTQLKELTDFVTLFFTFELEEVKEETFIAYARYAELNPSRPPNLP